MKRNVTDFDFIQGAFNLLPKDAQKEIHGVAVAHAAKMEKSRRESSGQGGNEDLELTSSHRHQNYNYSQSNCL